jgi:hypothetical protein
MQAKQPQPTDKGAKEVKPRGGPRGGKGGNGGQARLKGAPGAQERSDPGLPGGGKGRIDVTGIIPEGVRVDPDLTEGHPGYDESGESEMKSRTIQGERSH